MAKPAESNPHRIDADATGQHTRPGVETNRDNGTHNPSSQGKGK